MKKNNIERFKVYQGVFDQFTLNTLETLKRKKYFDSLMHPIKTGKEADVYLAKKDNNYLAIKIYRVTSANFNKISDYIKRDYRFKNIKGNLRKVIMMWVQKEFRNLSICNKNQIFVPYPYKQLNNVIIMEYIDSLMLKDTNLENPTLFFKILLEQLILLKNKAKLIHADLSEYNILVKNNLPIIIDLGQSMIIKSPIDFKNFYDLFLRDITNIVNYFNKKYKLNLKLETILEKINQKQN